MNATATQIAHLKPPRIPSAPPVSVVEITARSSRVTKGYGAAIFVVSDLRGRTVEIIHDQESALHRRYPWFAHYYAESFGACKLATAYPAARIEVSPTEARTWLLRGRAENLDTSPDLARLRATADRCEAHAVLLDAIGNVRRSASSYEPQNGAVVYHRATDPGGAHVRRAFGAMARAGMVDVVYLDDTHGQYRPTATTPRGR